MTDIVWTGDRTTTEQSSATEKAMKEAMLQELLQLEMQQVRVLLANVDIEQVLKALEEHGLQWPGAEAELSTAPFFEHDDTPRPIGVTISNAFELRDMRWGEVSLYECQIPSELLVKHFAHLEGQTISSEMATSAFSSALIDAMQPALSPPVATDLAALADRMERPAGVVFSIPEGEIEMHRIGRTVERDGVGKVVVGKVTWSGGPDAQVEAGCLDAPVPLFTAYRSCPQDLRETFDRVEAAPVEWHIAALDEQAINDPAKPVAVGDSVTVADRKREVRWIDRGSGTIGLERGPIHSSNVRHILARLCRLWTLPMDDPTDEACQIELVRRIITEEQLDPIALTDLAHRWPDNTPLQRYIEAWHPVYEQRWRELHPPTKQGISLADIPDGMIPATALRLASAAHESVDRRLQVGDWCAVGGVACSCHVY